MNTNRTKLALRRHSIRPTTNQGRGAMTLTSNTAPARLRRLLPATVFPAVGLAAMILFAPAAYAETEQQIKSDCEAAGGSYISFVSEDGDVNSQCFIPMTSRNGGKWNLCTFWLNGQRQGSNVHETPTGTVHPVQPPPGTAPAAPGASPAGPQPAQPPRTTAAPVFP